MSLTPAQQEAVAANGNILLVAGAGTGKTRTLVARALHCLLREDPPAALDEILMVTFTEAAALEMRQRLRDELEKVIHEKQAHGKTRASEPEIGRLSEQLALFDAAHIGTLHSFCLKLVRQHFYALELDPQLAVMPEEEARLRADETLDEILEAHYTGKGPEHEAVRQLIRAQGREGDAPIRALVLRLHHYTQTLHDPDGWFDGQLSLFHSPEPTQWKLWLGDGIIAWRNRWLPALQNAETENLNAAQSLALLNRLPLPANPREPERPLTLPSPPMGERVSEGRVRGSSANSTHEDYTGKFLGEFSTLLDEIHRLGTDFPRGKKTAWRKPFEDFYDEAAFFSTLAKPDGRALAEDWHWVRGQMATLLELAREFTAAFSAAKRELGMVDFHDLEQHALRLLWDREANQPTAVAREWRERLRFVFVDEYQDINDAQDAILRALSRDGAAANRFLVGDIKQSIYRFRLADPRIFQNYINTWRGAAGQAIPLVDNFRSREGVLDFVNSLFGALMRREMGGVPYDETAKLRFGDPEHRSELSRAENPAPCVELHLRLKGAAENAASDDDSEASPGRTELTSLDEAGKEARIAALRLAAMKADGHLVWDESRKCMRPVEWRDMAVLLRSPSGKAECFAREFTRLGVPLIVARGAFYESIEINDLLNLLRLLDNPLQDVPLIAVLHSPLVGLSLDELAAIRLELRDAHFWSALQRFVESRGEHPGWQRAARFLKNFSAWRRLARQAALSHCLETVLNETHYPAWLLAQSRGEQRYANVRRLVALSRQFDQFQRQSLPRFLRFIEAQQAAQTEPEVAAVSGDDSVSLMSIHQSKGLEFPVVVLADLGKPFNLSDLQAEIILDEKFGLCPQVKPPQTGGRYPSLPYELACQRQRQEMLGEELRLLYVATTRARDTLILTGNVSAKKFSGQWREQASLDTTALLGAKCFLDWLAAWSAQNGGTFITPPAGENNLLRWTIYDDQDARLLNASAIAASTQDMPASAASNEASLEKLRRRLAWKYGHDEATHILAKTSVSALRRQWADDAEEEAAPAFRFPSRPPKSNAAGPSRLSASEIGSAHHLFLQWVPLERTGTVNELKAEAARLEREKLLSPEQSASLDFAAIESFWNSDLGSEIRAASAQVRRELPFTARFSPHELSGIVAEHAVAPDDEFVVVQGVADLVVLQPREIWLVDFKTDRVDESELPARTKQYEPQLQLYARALSRIYGRPVTRLHLYFLALKRAVALPCA
jgi:ATP-dependent helicase/nuclease subunit A